MGQAISKIAIIGEQHQPFAVGVEPPYRKYPRIVGHQLEHSRPVVCIVRG
jgi:hypothetical protein